MADYKLCTETRGHTYWEWGAVPVGQGLYLAQGDISPVSFSQAGVWLYCVLVCFVHFLRQSLMYQVWLELDIELRMTFNL